MSFRALDIDKRKLERLVEYLRRLVVKQHRKIVQAEVLSLNPPQSHPSLSS